MTKLILTHEVDGLGGAGDVVDVKAGYARNYLVPRGLAMAWTKGAQRQVDQINAARRAREIATIEEARDIRDRLQAKAVTVAVRASDAGRLFGGVTTQDIAQAVKDEIGASIDKRKIQVGTPIRTLGEHKVSIRLHPDVEATIAVKVIPAK